MGMYVGVSGSSLKKEENLEVVKEIPTDQMLLETGNIPIFWHTKFHTLKLLLDAPYGYMTKNYKGFPHVDTHPEKTSFVRNQPYSSISV